MKISRSTALKIYFLLDQCLPPIVRDSNIFAAWLFRFVYGTKANVFLNFKQRAFQMSEQEFAGTYRDIESVLMERDTDLNEACLHAVLQNIVGETVLEVGAGKGLLAGKMSAKYQVTACDLIPDPALRAHPKIHFEPGNVESLPFANAEFDTVVCAHTLEHVQNLLLAVNELRRVTKQRLIVVVPKQRSYRYTFDLHLHFFPYEYSLIAVMGTGNRYMCREISGDWFYVEDR